MTSSEHASQLDYAMAGGGSGFVTRMLTQPLDVLKIRFQLQIEPIARIKSSKYQSVVQSFSLIIREEGVKALWKGHVPAQVLSVTYGIAQFWCFEGLIDQVAKLDLNPSPTPMINFTCGALAGSFATVASFPSDVVRTRLIAQSETHKIYSGVLDSFRVIVKQEGFFALYRGLLPTLIQIAPHTGIQFMCYKFFNNTYKIITNSPRTTLVGSFIAGSLAGCVAKTAIYPLDLAKKRLQIQGFEKGRIGFGKFFSCRGLFDCVRRIYYVEGVWGLFKGLSPSLLKAGFSTALYFSCYEMILMVLAKRH